VKLSEGISSSSRKRCSFPKEAARGEASFRNKFASFGKPPEVKLPEGSRRTCFFQNKFRKKKDALPEGSEGRPSFGRTPFLREDALSELLSLPSGSSLPSGGRAYSRRKRVAARKPPEVKLPEGSEGRPSFGRKPKDGNKFASFGKPPEVKLSEGSRRTRFFQNKFASFGKPPEVKLPEGRSSSRRTRFFQNKFASFGFLRKAATPPEVKLSEGSRHPARGEAFRRTPKEAEGRKQVASFGNLWRFLRKAARGEASRRTFASFGKPPEVKLPEGRSETSCFLREPLALPSEREHAVCVLILYDGGIRARSAR